MRNIKEIEARYEQRRETKGKVNLFKKRYILIVVLLVAFITNPGKEKHKNKVLQRVESAIGTNVYSSESGGIQRDSVLDRIVDSYIDYSNYFFFSTTSIQYQGEYRTIGIGMLGYVYIPESLGTIIKNN